MICNDIIRLIMKCVCDMDRKCCCNATFMLIMKSNFIKLSIFVNQPKMNDPNEEFYAYDPYERAHPFLEVFCSCWLPESRLKPQYELKHIGFRNNYLAKLVEPDIGLTGDSYVLFLHFQLRIYTTFTFYSRWRHNGSWKWCIYLS